MSGTVLNFHRTTHAPAAEDLHTIDHREFDAALATIAALGLSIADPMRRFDRLHGAARSVTLTFDDGASSDVANAKKLASRGWTAMFFISTSLVGAPGYLNWQQVRELRQMGMSIGSHAHRHVPLTTLDVDEVRLDLQQSRAELQDRLGEPVEHLAWPGGCFDGPRQEVALDLGFRALWTTQWGDDANQGEPGPHRAIRRNNIIQGQSASELTAILQGRSQWSRRAVHAGMDVAKRTLSAKGYQRLRAFALQARSLVGRAERP